MSTLARRRVLTSLAGLPLAAVLADPRLAAAAAAGLETVSLTTAGGKAVKAALALPTSTPASAVLLVHEWWGLNDQIKSVAAELAKEGYVALAVDLYDGKVADNRDDARNYMLQRMWYAQSLDRFAFVGKRVQNPENLQRVAELFVDRWTPAVIVYFALYVGLSTVDTICTFVFMKSGSAVELNPILRPLLEEHPLVFLLSKTTLALVPFLVVSRFQMFRLGKVLLPLTVLAYLMLDLYWVVILSG